MTAPDPFEIINGYNNLMSLNRDLKSNEESCQKYVINTLAEKFKLSVETVKYIATSIHAETGGIVMVDNCGREKLDYWKAELKRRGYKPGEIGIKILSCGYVAAYLKKPYSELEMCLKSQNQQS